ncbi:MAG: lysostaphin resistance A-like protein [Candidatus Nanoarchaeia archaeon]
MPYYADQLSAYAENMRQMSIPILMLMFLSFLPIVLVDSPIHEEIFFRGYYSGMLSERFKPVVGVLASTLFFGPQHALGHPEWHLGMVIATIPLGFILALTYQKTKSLISVIFAHFLLNFIPISSIIFFAAGHASIAISACLAIALTSVIILIVCRHRAKDLFLNELKTLKHIDHRSLILVSLFTALPLVFNYLAIMFKSHWS